MPHVAHMLLHVRHMCYRPAMSKMIQLRNVPDRLHRRLKEQAASLGLSLSDYLIREAQTIAERPTKEEFLARLRQLTPLNLDVSPTQMIREERDRMSGYLMEDDRDFTAKKPNPKRARRR